MIYKITLKLDVDNINELENILDNYGIEYEVNEVYESEVK